MLEKLVLKVCFYIGIIEFLKLVVDLSCRCLLNRSGKVAPPAGHMERNAFLAHSRALPINLHAGKEDFQVDI